MKMIIWPVAMLMWLSSYSQEKKQSPYILFGIDYRQYPIDIEDVPRGPLRLTEGYPMMMEDFGRLSV
jgi:hypothetical protein